MKKILFSFLLMMVNAKAAQVPEKIMLPGLTEVEKMRMHQMMVANGVEWESGKPKQIVCGFCYFKTEDPKKLTDHVRKEHIGTKKEKWSFNPHAYH